MLRWYLHMKVTSQAFPISINCRRKILLTVLFVVLHWTVDCGKVYCRHWHLDMNRPQLAFGSPLILCWQHAAAFTAKVWILLLLHLFLSQFFLSQLVLMPRTGLTHPAGITKPRTAPRDWSGCRLIKTALGNNTLSYITKEMNGVHKGDRNENYFSTGLP